MPILHVRLYGSQTQINLPSVIRQARFKLKSYRFLFSRENHGFYHGSLHCALFANGNVLGFVQEGNPVLYSYDLPLFLDPEKKLTQMDNCDWDLGVVNNLNSVLNFTLKLHNCIERRRYDQAVFDPKDNSQQQYKSLNPQQAYFGNDVSRVVAFDANDYASYDHWDKDGNLVEVQTDINGNPVDATTVPPVAPVYPNANKYIHTGVALNNLDPQPGNGDYDTRAVNPNEQYVITRSTQQGAALTGSGFRKGPIIYPYALDLVFEYSTTS